MDNVQKYIQLTAVVIGVVTPCVLLAGYIYYLGYITAFALDSSLMNRGLSDVITESWYMGALLLMYFFKKWWWLLVFFGLVAIALLGLFLYVVRLKKNGVDLFAKPITKENQGRSILGLTQWHWIGYGTMLVEVGTLPYILLAILAVATTVVIIPFHMGNQEAIKAIDNFQTHGCEATAAKPLKFSRCIDLIDIANATTLAQGLMVTANSERIVIFTPHAIEIWPLLDNYKLQKTYKPKKAEK